MVGKSGAARIALETGCPVIPTVNGARSTCCPPTACGRDFFPRKPIRMRVGDPVDLSDLLDVPGNSEVTAEATRRIMNAITELVSEIRGEDPPVERYDMRVSGVPNGKSRKDAS